MTPGDLRAEAERMARQVFGGYAFSLYPKDFQKEMTEALVAFAQQHAERVEKRARLEGRIEGLKRAACVLTPQIKYATQLREIVDVERALRARLAALGGEKEAG